MVGRKRKRSSSATQSNSGEIAKRITRARSRELSTASQLSDAERNPENDTGNRGDGTETTIDRTNVGETESQTRIKELKDKVGAMQH